MDSLARLLEAAVDAGADYADVRHMHVRDAGVELRDMEVQSLTDSDDVGVGLTVLVDGAWGFAASSGTDFVDTGALVQRAMRLARRSRTLVPHEFNLAAEPTHVGTWEGQITVDPFTVSMSDQIDLIRSRSHQLLTAPGIDHVDAQVGYVREHVRYEDTSGTSTEQVRYRIHAEWTATAVDAVRGSFESMRTCAPPVARGWEYLTGDCVSVGSARRWDWAAEFAQLPDWLAQRCLAKSVEPGNYTLVLDPTNLWLTIHESVGHATELDRSVGFEANYAGTTFVTPTDMDRLRYGSPLMNIVADRTTEHGLATVGWDDQGVTAQRWPLVTEGVLSGFQTDRTTAHLIGESRSRGCSYADAAEHMAISRMPNVSLLPDPSGGTTGDLIAGVCDGIYIVGDRSWSIDMQRYNFQFTGQRFYRIKNGELQGQLTDVAYQSSTPKFWNSLTALGGPSTALLAGAVNCGKGQPGQVAPVSHDCPSAVFENVRVLNTGGDH